MTADFNIAPVRTAGDLAATTDLFAAYAAALPVDLGYQDFDGELAALPGKGIKKVAILAPAFSADCIETLEEIAMQGKETFMEAGGEKFAYIPCLNDSPGGMDMIEAVVRRELSGWL